MIFPDLREVQAMPGSVHYNGLLWTEQLDLLYRVWWDSEGLHARWNKLKDVLWPAYREFGPNTDDHHGTLQMIAWFGSSGWRTVNVEWLRPSSGERKKTDVGLDEGHQIVWQTMARKTRLAEFKEWGPDSVHVVVFYLAGVPGKNEIRSNLIYLNPMTGQEVFPEDSDAPEDPPDDPPDEPPGNISRIRTLMHKIELELREIEDATR